MFLNTLSINNYKSFSSAKFNFEKKINCFIGKNGVGKSNIIDSIYHLAFTKSYFNPSSNQNIKIGTDFFSINGEFLISKRKEEIHSGTKWNLWKQSQRKGTITIGNQSEP